MHYREQVNFSEIVKDAFPEWYPTQVSDDRKLIKPFQQGELESYLPEFHRQGFAEGRQGMLTVRQKIGHVALVSLGALSAVATANVMRVGTIMHDMMQGFRFR